MIPVSMVVARSVRKRRIVPVLAAACLLAAAPGAVAQEEARASAAPQEPASLAVTTDLVRREAIATEIAGTGLVASWQEVAIGVETSGLVLSDVLVAEGDRIAQGQVIARLDGAILEAQMGEQDAAIRSAEASLEDAAAANDRALRLSRTGNITEETLQERATALKTAEAALAQARAVRQTLAVQVARTVIRAPFAGTVTAEPAVRGAVVQIGTEIARLRRDGVLEARLQVPEAKIAGLAVGDPATIVGPSGAAVEAAVSRIAEAVDADTHLVLVHVRLPADAGLKAGMFVRGTIRSGGDPQMTVATSALTWRDGRTAVFAVSRDGIVTLREVTAGERADGRVAVTGDLRPGDAVVTAGAGFLSDGNRVSVVRNDASLEGGTR